MYVVTSLNLGWDCIVAVYPDSIDTEVLEQAYPEHQDYAIHKTVLGTIEDVLDKIEEDKEDL